MATTSISPTARSKGYLVRGIDPIPEGWEFASGHRARRGLRRSCTVLTRLISDAVAAGDKALARDLRGVLTAVERARAHETGGFVIKEIEPEARQWARVTRKAHRFVARQKARIAREKQPRLKLVVDNEAQS